MITYDCSSCGQDFAVTEFQKPVCFYCQAQVGFTIAKKEKLTPVVMAARLKLVTDRMMENLQKAYAVRPEEVDEQELLSAMKKAKDLKDQINNLSLNDSKSNSRE